ncbi:DUF2865 domain-containing protein [Acuticoccus sp. M5D2P5]|uniref:DUF2865 domain-containing protein n=1 Tax=Acuticoccus kalidii TaxID=2910977 RepID=UPI001F44256F|nr:DUF2865 domain-containing protein [Acuticoccus kalidii]MCF3932724.1 DUF2865 domain-containing protein [Acuticoccus kalidii]
MQKQARAYGCNSASAWGRHRACAGIEAQLRRAGGGDARQIRELQRRVDRACNAPVTASRQPARSSRRQAAAPASGVIIHGTRPDNHLDARAKSNGGGSFLSSIFGGRREESEEIRTVRHDPSEQRYNGKVEKMHLDERRYRESGKEDDGKTVRLATQSSDRAKGELRVGSTRTVCVRLCDGFYFPINSQSHSDNFYDELAMCVGRCPGADVSLYAHNASSPVETMRSTMTGERYVNLPTAFDYRKEAVPNCGCQPQTTIAEDMNSEKALTYVGLGSAHNEKPQTALEAAEVAASDSPSWTPYRAVYDATGKPLPPSLTDRSPPADESNAVATVAIGSTSESSSSQSASQSLVSESERVREVGPQFYSAAAMGGAKAQPVRHVPRYTTTAVQVVPITPSVILPNEAIDPIVPVEATAPTAEAEPTTPTVTTTPIPRPKAPRSMDHATLPQDSGA